MDCLRADLPETQKVRCHARYSTPQVPCFLSDAKDSGHAFCCPAGGGAVECGMHEIDRRILKRVAGVHAAVVVVLMSYGFLSGCFRKPPDVVIPIEFLVDVRAAEPVAAERMPEPVRRPRPDPVPDPVVPPEPPRRREIQVNTNRVVRRTDPPATPPPATPQPTLSQEEIRRLLAAGAQASDRTSIPDEDQRGLAIIRSALYAVWQPPSKASAGDAEAVLMLRLEPDGSVRSAALSRRSGNEVLDRSVEQVGEQVRRIHGLPPGFASRRAQVTIAFTVE